jgi:hypothetical protein
MVSNETNPSGTLRAIRVHFHAHPAHDSPDARRERALNALATALIVIPNGSSRAWAIQEVPSEPLAHDVMPLSDEPVPTDDGWAMVYALRGQPEVAAAEPSFVGAHAAAPGARNAAQDLRNEAAGPREP